MDLYGHVLCRSCRKEYRIRRRMERGARYRFACKRCGAETSFCLEDVRWACEQARVPRRSTEEVEQPIFAARRRQQQSPPAARVAPEPEPQPAGAGLATISDRRPPLHLGPHGVEPARESSRVSWLRRMIERREGRLVLVGSA
jgi:hypothetical protein